MMLWRDVSKGLKGSANLTGALHPKQGFAIMLVLMMLFLLFMLGVAFFFSAWTHAFMARNYLNMKRARVVAEGGVHHAMGAILGDFVWLSHAQNKPADFRWRYGDDPETPVEYALSPSYAMGRTITILGMEVGLSGVMDPGGGAYGINSDIFHLKVMECSAQLYVNEGLGHPYNTAVMRRILNNLGDQLGIKELGDTIIDNRPSDGYNTKAELKRVLGEHYDIVKDFLCVATWSDPQVVNPVPLSTEASSAYDAKLYQTRPGYPNNPVTRHGRMGDPLRFGGPLYAYHELNPGWIEVTRRAPVNINTAPRQILVSLLEDLEGFFVMESLASLTDVGEVIYCEFDRSFQGVAGIIFRTTPVDKAMAETIARAIIERRQRQPFRTWQDFNSFIDGLVWHEYANPTAPIKDTRTRSQLQWFVLDPYYRLEPWDMYPHYASQALADTIKANFNPNLHLNELNPDANLWGWVDKTDLIKNSTEFCFLPTGYFEIESVGQILRAEWEDGKFHISPYLLIMKDSFEYNNQIMGQRRLKVVAKLWDIRRETVQQEFVRGQFSESIDVPYRTNMNLALLCGPEPLNSRAASENNYEGYICLSTTGGSMPKDQRWVKGKLYQTQDFKGDANLGEEDASPYKACEACQATGKCNNCTGTGEVECRCSEIRKCKGGEYTCTYGCGHYRVPWCNNTGMVSCWECDGTGRCPVCGGSGTLPGIRMHAHYDLDFSLHGSIGDDAPVNIVSDKAQRMDGFFAEAGWRLLYPSGDGNFGNDKGAVSYWIKPGFVPELGGRIRIFSSIVTGNFLGSNIVHYWGWTSGSKEDPEHGWEFRLPIHSMGFYMSGWPGWIDWFTGFVSRHTYTLNHVYHGFPGPGWQTHEPGDNNMFLAHRWLHVTGVAWKYRETSFLSKVNLCLNGRIDIAPGRVVWYTAGKQADYTDGGQNPFVLGGNISGYAKSPNCTFDEFYLYADIEEYTITVLKPCNTCQTTGALACRDCNIASCSNCAELFACMDNGYKCPPPCTRCAPCSHCLVLEECKATNYRCVPSSIQPPPQCYTCRCSYTCESLGDCKDNDYKCHAKYANMKCYSCRYLEYKRCNYTCSRLGECKPQDYRCYKDRCHHCGKYCYGDCGTNQGACEDIQRKCKSCTSCDPCKSDCPPASKACQDRDFRCVTCSICGGDGWIEDEEKRIGPPEKAFIEWRRGRYYRQNDAVFTSSKIDLARMVRRKAADPNQIDDPYDDPRWKSDEGAKQGETVKWLARTWYHPGIKVLGLSWTGYTHDIQDYKETPPVLLSPQLEVSLEAKDGQGNWVQIAGPFLSHDAGWAAVFAKIPSSKIRYRVRFNTRCDPANAILLETPVFDDLTIYYSIRPQFLSWVESY
jgi:hypothetical protein